MNLKFPFLKPPFYVLVSFGTAKVVTFFDLTNFFHIFLNNIFFVALYTIKM
jgi:hypothetical protein